MAVIIKEMRVNTTVEKKTVPQDGISEQAYRRLREEVVRELSRRREPFPAKRKRER